MFMGSVARTLAGGAGSLEESQQADHLQAADSVVSWKDELKSAAEKKQEIEGALIRQVSMLISPCCWHFDSVSDTLVLAI